VCKRRFVAQRISEYYVKTLATAMFETEHRMGIALIHQKECAVLRWGNMTSRPFGLAMTPCLGDHRCTSGRKFDRIGEKTRYGTRQVYWMCETHGPVAQTFSTHLVGWWQAGLAGHLARWDELMDPPPPI
jgi:hypothetical protein